MKPIAGKAVLGIPECNGIGIPDASGFFAQGDNFEEARNHLREVIEGNVILSLQLHIPIPSV